MKKIFYLALPLVLFSACSGGKENASNEQQTEDTIEDIIADIVYTQYPLAFLSDGELYFCSFEDDKKMKFVEETEPILNFTFDAEGKILYYNVERDNSLWLKSVDISISNQSPEWVIDWKFKKDECISETYGEASPLLYHKGELLIEHKFSWDFYGFESMTIYSIANNKITPKESNYSLIQKFSGVVSFDKIQHYFKTTKQQLYYMRNNANVCLTDNLDFKVLRQKENEDFWVDTEYTNYFLSPDEKKIIFGAVLEIGDLGHGPYCVANVDGSHQMLLKNTDIACSKRPIWLKNNRVAFVDNDKNLFVANNDENSIQKIAENVSFYVAR